MNHAQPLKNEKNNKIISYGESRKKIIQLLKQNKPFVSIVDQQKAVTELRSLLDKFKDDLKSTAILNKIYSYIQLPEDDFEEFIVLTQHECNEINWLFDLLYQQIKK